MNSPLQLVVGPVRLSLLKKTLKDLLVQSIVKNLTPVNPTANQPLTSKEIWKPILGYKYYGLHIRTVDDRLKAAKEVVINE